MSEAVKKLTVSYGAFSCTLEGFDDPFPVMKMVVDYFQSLADRDPSFGAHPERPDAEYLRNLAQRGTNQNIEVETQDNGVILRQTFETMPETADAATTMRGLALSLVPRKAADNGAVMAADFADEMFTSIERRDFPSEMQRAFEDRSNPGGQKPQNDPSSAYDREERALERLLNAARLRSGTEQTLASANPMSQIKEALQEQMDSHLFDDAAPLESLPDSDFVTDLVEPDAEIEKIEMIGIGTLPISEPETPADHETEAETQPDSELGMPDTDAVVDELNDSNSTLSMNAATDTAPEIAVDIAEIEPAAAAISAASDELSHLEDATAAAESIEIEPADAAISAASDELSHVEQATAAAESIEIAETMAAAADQNAATPTESEILPEVSLETLVEPTELQTALSAEIDPADDKVASTGDPVEFAWNGTRAEQAEASQAKPDDTSDETDALAAALQRTKLNEPAAMPLLVLGPALMIVSGDQAVLQHVEPTEMQSEPQPSDDTRRQIVRTRPEAVDFDYDAEARRAQPEAPFADLTRHGAKSEDFDEAVDADDTGITLDNFARKVGAASLPELLEASAAYVTIVSGQPRFSRASILNMVDELSNERSYTQEARIKSFGKLLRNGSILRVEDGKFAISHSAKFNYEVKISA